jgi:hypothetical protein
MTTGWTWLFMPTKRSLVSIYRRDPIPTLPRQSLVPTTTSLPPVVDGNYQRSRQQECVNTQQTPIDFRMSQEAAAYNSALLEMCQLDLGRFLQDHNSTMLNYGSEFQPIPQLKQILGDHPNFDEIQ